MTAFWQGQATDYRDLIVQLRDFATSNHVDTASPSAAGTGYSVGDILTAVGGTFFVAATFEVLTVGGSGEVLTIKIRQSGAYTVNPASPVATTVVPAGGTGATITVAFLATGWTVRRDDASAAHDAAERELILEGTGSGADQIFVGVRSYFNSGADARNWELGGFTGFDSGQTWELQPGKSPGRFDSALGGAFVPLINSTIDFWFNFDPRRMIGVMKVGTTYLSFYMGFLNPFATASEFPYPLYIAGCTSDFDNRFSDTILTLSGLADPIKHDDDASDVGPAFIRFTDGQWYSVHNSQMTGTTTRNDTRDRMVFPAADFRAPVEDRAQWFGGLDNFNAFIPSSGVPGNPTRVWQPTPDAGGDIYQLWPCTLQMTTPSEQLLGEMDDVFWFGAAGGVLSEDTLNTDFTAFQSGNRSEPFAFFAMRTSL